MSKKHFIKLADAIIEQNKSKNPRAFFTQEHLEALATFCALQNSNFKKDRWLDYIAGRCTKNGGAL